MLVFDNFIIARNWGFVKAKMKKGLSRRIPKDAFDQAPPIYDNGISVYIFRNGVVSHPGIEGL